MLPSARGMEEGGLGTGGGGETSRLLQREREERDLVSRGLCSSSLKMPTLLGPSSVLGS